MTHDEKNEAAAVRWVGDGPRVTATDHRDFHTALAHVVNLVTALTNLRAAHERALTTERTRREAAEREVERLTVEDLPAAKAMTERVGAMYRAEMQRREAAEREHEAAVLEVNDLHEAWHNQVTALRERAEKAEARAEGLAALKLGEQLDAQRKETAAVRDRLATAERELDEALELVAVLRRSAETSEAFDDLASRTSGLLAKTHEAELASALAERDEARAGERAAEAAAHHHGDRLRESLASRDAALAALAEVSGVAWDLVRDCEGNNYGPGLSHNGQCPSAEHADKDCICWVDGLARLRSALAASPAALGAKVIARERERGAVLAIRWMDDNDPPDDATDEEIAALVCKAAGGAR